MNKLQTTLTYLNSFALLILLGLVAFGSPVAELFGAAPSSASTFYDVNVDSSNGIGTGSYYINGTATLTPQGLSIASGAVTSSVVNISTRLNLISGEITGFDCATATTNPVAIASSTGVTVNATSTPITLSGALNTDECIGVLSSATTSAAHVSCNITAADTATLFIQNLGDAAAALDLGSGTAEVCYIRAQ